MHFWHARLCVFSVANMYICTRSGAEEVMSRNFPNTHPEMKVSTWNVLKENEWYMPIDI